MSAAYGIASPRVTCPVIIEIRNARAAALVPGKARTAREMLGYISGWLESAAHMASFSGDEARAALYQDAAAECDELAKLP